MGQRKWRQSLIVKKTLELLVDFERKVEGKFKEVNANQRDHTH